MKKNKVVVITGASAGVGRAIANAFAKKKAKILLIARGEERLAQAKIEVEKKGGEAWIFPADVSKPDEVEAAAQYAETNIGPIDIWINNAMVSVYSRVSDMEPLEYKRVTEVTYLGQVYGTKAALRYMRLRNRGKIILIGSALAFRGIPLQSAYCASKHAIQGFFESLRSELIHDRSGISLSMVHLPAMNTPQFTWTKSRFKYKPQPMGRIFQPEVAAREVVRIAETEERMSMVGFTTVKTVLGNKIVPQYLDNYLAEIGFEDQFTDEPADPDRGDNLWHPYPGDFGARGTFDKEAHNFSVYNGIVNNKKTIAVMAATLLGWWLIKRSFKKCD